MRGVMLKVRSSFELQSFKMLLHCEWESILAVEIAQARQITMNEQSVVFHFNTIVCSETYASLTLVAKVMHENCQKLTISILLIYFRQRVFSRSTISFFCPIYTCEKRNITECRCLRIPKTNSKILFISLAYYNLFRVIEIQNKWRCMCNLHNTTNFAMANTLPEGTRHFMRSLSTHFAIAFIDRQQWRISEHGWYATTTTPFKKGQLTMRNNANMQLSNFKMAVVALAVINNRRDGNKWTFPLYRITIFRNTF